MNNEGSNVIINGGAGADSICNYRSAYGDADSITVDGGDGDDNIDIQFDGGFSAHISINGGAGNDYIYNYQADNITINGGTGKDSIYNFGANVLFQYTSGDDSDTIDGFRADSTLQIGGGNGTYSSQVSGSDIIVNVGEGSVLLKDATMSELILTKSPAPKATTQSTIVLAVRR